MKFINPVFVLLFMCFTVSCATIYDVQYDYDKQANFESLKTYDWMTVPEKADIDSFAVERVKKAVNTELQARGLIMTSNNPDFLIAEHLGKKDKEQVTKLGYDYNPYGGYWEGYSGPRGGYWGEYSGPRGGYSGPSGTSTYEYEEGSLILDFVDGKSKKMIWRGAAKAEINTANTPEKREKLINETVQEILKHFPPKP